jgi:signal transduction histidine kinase
MNRVMKPAMSRGGAGSAEGEQSGAYSIRRRLQVLAAVSIVPAALASMLLLGYAYTKERDATAQQVQTTARALSIVVDRQLGQAEALMSALATAPALIDGDFDAFDQQAREANTYQGSWVVVRDVTGRQMINTRLPRGAPLPHSANVAAQFSNLIAGGPHISNLIPTSAVGSPVVGVDIPVLRRGIVVYDLAIVLQASTFDRVFNDQRLPEGWIGVIIDREGKVVRRSRDAEDTVGHLVSADFQLHLKAARSDGAFESRNLEGMPTFVAYSRSPTSGWVFAVAMPRDALGSAARHSLYLAVAIGISLIGFGALMARRIADGIARQIEGLADRAAALGRGELAPRSPTGLAEADLVARALQQAGESIHGFTATLEQRVAERTRDLASANQRLSSEIEERRRAEDQLARVQRMEAVGQLSGGIAHDFNNLLQAVIGNIDLARSRTSDPKAAKFLEHAIAAAERGAKLIGQLLAFSRKQRLEPSAIDVNALVSGLIEMLRSTIGSGVVIETQLETSAWRGLADATQLELIVLNLAINARDAMPEGGVIVIGTANVTLAAPGRAEEPQPGDYVELSVTDTGTGMADDVMAKVFEPFFTTKEVGKGSGLGLSQVLGLAQQLGGGVRLESIVGQGTTVRVYLPRA